MSLLTAKRRNSLPTKEFAGPDRSYPIQDASHARNALARASGKPVERQRFAPRSTASILALAKAAWYPSERKSRPA